MKKAFLKYVTVVGTEYYGRVWSADLPTHVQTLLSLPEPEYLEVNGDFYADIQPLQDGFNTQVLTVKVPCALIWKNEKTAISIEDYLDLSAVVEDIEKQVLNGEGYVHQ